MLDKLGHEIVYKKGRLYVFKYTETNGKEAYCLTDTKYGPTWAAYSSLEMCIEAAQKITKGMVNRGSF